MKFVYTFLLLPFLAGCPFNKCGNGTTDAREECDDGNELDADGCEADCSLPACNNGINDPGELCLNGPATAETDTGPFEVVAADLNGDSHQDLITSNLVGNSLSILFGNGAGSFTRQPDIELGGPAFFLATGDFNGDQLPDLATGLSITDTVEVFTNAGDGTFSPFATLPAEDAGNLLARDFDNDGDTDILTTSIDGIVLFLNNGAGFQAPRITFIGSNTTVSTADFDNDGNLDLAVGINGELQLRLGDGVGNFAPQTPQLAGQIQARFTPIDLNGDQFPDLANANLLSEEISLFTNDNGTFTLSQTFSVNSPAALTTSDLNGDQLLDLAIASDLDANSNSHLVTITSNAGALNAQEPLLTGNGNLRGITTADLNGDQLPDVILTNNSNNQLVLFLSQP